MSLFLILMIAGLFGMCLMAFPAFSRHAGSHGAAGHAAAHLGHAARRAAPRSHFQGGRAGGARGSALSRFAELAEPRVLFSLLTLFGAFGFGLNASGLLSKGWAALAAIVPTLLVERLVLNRLWYALLGFQGQPSSPLENLILTEAVAVTEFHNGKGVVQVVRDGRAVQMSAHLADQQGAMQVRVGDMLRVENIDAAHERVTVSLH